MTAPHPEGIGVIAVMKNCLQNAGIKPEDVDHINTSYFFNLSYGTWNCSSYHKSFCC